MGDCGCKMGAIQEVQAVAFPVPVGGGRYTFDLPPVSNVKAWSVVILNRDTVAPANAVNLFFAVMPAGNMVPALLTGNGLYRTPGASYKVMIPGDRRTLVIDFAGLEQDFVTSGATVAHISIKACGGGAVPKPGCPE